MQSIELLTKPSSVRATATAAKGTLHFPAATQRVQRTSTRGSFCCGTFQLEGEGVPLFLSPQFVPPTNAQGQPSSAPWVCPFWMITGAEEQSLGEANMVLRSERVEVGGFTVEVPVLVNARRLEPGEELSWRRSERVEGAKLPAAKKARKSH